MVQKYLLSQYLLTCFYVDDVSNDDVAGNAGDVIPDSGTGITSTCAFKNISFTYFKVKSGEWYM